MIPVKTTIAAIQGKVLLLCLLFTTTLAAGHLLSDAPWSGGSPAKYSAFTSCRAHSGSLKEFGAVGDGKTSNTKAFHDAVARLSQFSASGGALLYVPPGRWLTGPFNLTSHFTLFLDRDAVILASQDLSEWPIIAPLPSYGRGRDKPGPRFSNFISGTDLTDVVITGNNGTIDGQGAFWWTKWKSLKYTRGALIELVSSDHILLSDITLKDSPFWNFHPVYSSNIIVSGITILAPVKSHNTDGIDPDSCSNVRIEDCYIMSGDDCVAIKSGWDEYGIKFGKPSQHIAIRRLTCISPTSAAIAIGSEMSGGVQDVRAEQITCVDIESAVRIKTAIGRGAFVKDIFVRNMNLHTMKWIFRMGGNYNSHPDNNFDPKAIPVVNGISFSDISADNVTIAGRMEGIPNAPFTSICMSNITAQMRIKKKEDWTCADIKGEFTKVTPPPCAQMQGSDMGKSCPFPTDPLPIDSIHLMQCSFSPPQV